MNLFFTRVLALFVMRGSWTCWRNVFCKSALITCMPAAVAAGVCKHSTNQNCQLHWQLVASSCYKAQRWRWSQTGLSSIGRCLPYSDSRWHCAHPSLNDRRVSWGFLAQVHRSQVRQVAFAATECLVWVHHQVPRHQSRAPPAAQVVEAKLATVSTAPHVQAAVLSNSGGVLISSLHSSNTLQALHRNKCRARLAISLAKLAPGVDTCKA